MTVYLLLFFYYFTNQCWSALKCCSIFIISFGYLIYLYQVGMASSKINYSSLHCTLYVLREIIAKMLQNSSFYLLFWTMPTCKALSLGPKRTVYIWRNSLDFQKYAIFGENSCPALPGKPELLRLGEIRSATGTKVSIEVWREGWYQWFLHLLAFLAVTAIQIWSNFVVGYISKLLPNFITSFVAQWSKHLPVETLMVTGSNPSLAKKYFLQKKI